jgi:hypothetical protein
MRVLANTLGRFSRCKLLGFRTCILPNMIHGHPPLDEVVVKHLELIQAVITRLANNSFLMKGWALTVAGAFYGFAVKGTTWQVAAIGLMPVVVFWGLDAYFLRQERLFRGLYDQVRQRNPAVEPFSMNAAAYAGGVASWHRTLLSRTLVPFYGPVFVIGVILTAILR